MSNKGFIKLNRGIFDNFLWNEAREFSKAEAWIDLIQLARFEASTEIINGKVIELQRGEIPASRRFLEFRWNWGSTKVSNFLKMLIHMKMINQRQANGQTVISLVKYGIYNDTQTTNNKDNKPRANHEQTNDKPEANQNKEYKEVKESKEENSNKTHAHSKVFIPPTIEEVCQYFNENGYCEDKGKIAWKYYNSAGWKDSKGNKIKSWKQKMIGVWFKDENKKPKNKTTNNWKLESREVTQEEVDKMLSENEIKIYSSEDDFGNSIKDVQL